MSKSQFVDFRAVKREVCRCNSSKSANGELSITRTPRALSKANTAECRITSCPTFLARNSSPWYSPTTKSSAAFSRMTGSRIGFSLPGNITRPSRAVAYRLSCSSPIPTSALFNWIRSPHWALNHDLRLPYKLLKRHVRVQQIRHNLVESLRFLASPWQASQSKVDCCSS